MLLINWKLLFLYPIVSICCLAYIYLQNDEICVFDEYLLPLKPQILHLNIFSKSPLIIKNCLSF